MKTFKQYINENVFSSLSGNIYWISPKGKIHKIDDDYGRHEEWALEHIVDADDIMDKYPDYGEEDVPDNEAGRDEIFQTSRNLGWADIHISDNDLLIRQPWGVLNYNVQTALKAFAFKYKLNIVQYYGANPRIVFSYEDL